MRNIKLILEYDGTDFSGWQFQPEKRTIQGEVESALGRLTQESIRTTAAGRTDAGVHALGQVINFFTDSLLSTEVFRRGGNALLPKDVRFVAAVDVPSDFNARFSAKSRQYRYFISQNQRAIGRQYCWYLPLKLDIDLMQEAVKDIMGEMDFQSFCQAGADIEHYHCLVSQAEWSIVDDKLNFAITANRFLHNMVRILVGTCVEIGRGALPVVALRDIIAVKDRQKAGPTVPAQGLFMMRVNY